MKKMCMLTLSLFLAASAMPAHAQDDVSFLKQSGGVVSKAADGAVKVSFSDGTSVKVSGAMMSTTDCNGRIFISDTNTNYLGISVPGKSVTSYSEPLNLKQQKAFMLGRRGS
jgi:hypothetical protein